MTSIPPTTTRCAILGQLALRDWSTYELTRSLRRTTQFFWPRAESVIYAEAKKLEVDGLVTARKEPAADGSRRSRTVYSITDAGRTVLRSWLARESETIALFAEPLLRVHLARFGTTADLAAAIASVRAHADEILAVADVVAAEFVAGEHIFQGEAHTRGLLFGALVALANSLLEWAESASAEVERWTTIDADDDARTRAVDSMRQYLERRRHDA